MKKRLPLLVLVLILGIDSLFNIAFSQIVNAVAPYTCTWTGAGGNTNFSTAANWSGCNNAAPQPTDDDNLVFDNTNLTSSQTLNNDITNLSVSSITFQGTNSNFYNFTLTGNPINIYSTITSTTNSYSTIDLNLNLESNLTVNINLANLYFGANASIEPTIMTNNNSITFNNSSSSCSSISIFSAVSGGGVININGTPSASVIIENNNPNLSGVINVNSGTLDLNSSGGLGSPSNVSVGTVGILDLGMNGNTSYNFPLTLDGGTLETSGQPLGGCTGGGYPNQSTATLTGSLTLVSNSYYDGGQETNTILTGTYNPGNYTLTATNTSQGTLTLPGNQQIETPPSTTTDSANSPSTNVLVGQNNTTTLTGNYGDVTVYSGGVLEGHGTVSGLLVNPGGNISLGQNCMNIGADSLTMGGTYNVVIGGTTPCSGYTQMIVSSSATSPIVLDNTATPVIQGKLNITLANGFVPKSGQTFTIINNQTGSPIGDNFYGLPEGSEITVGSTIFQITYKSPDPNSVVLSVVSVPKAPDTGSKLTNFSVGIPVLGSLALVGGMYLLNKRNKFSHKKK